MIHEQIMIEPMRCPSCDHELLIDSLQVSQDDKGTLHLQIHRIIDAQTVEGDYWVKEFPIAQDMQIAIEGLRAIEASLGTSSGTRVAGDD